jgi:hypothetical protein
MAKDVVHSPADARVINPNARVVLSNLLTCQEAIHSLRLRRVGLAERRLFQQAKVVGRPRQRLSQFGEHLVLPLLLHARHDLARQCRLDLFDHSNRRGIL